jgi:hypothetical protein
MTAIKSAPDITLQFFFITPLIGIHFSVYTPSDPYPHILYLQVTTLVDLPRKRRNIPYYLIILWQDMQMSIVRLEPLLGLNTQRTIVSKTITFSTT